MALDIEAALVRQAAHAAKHIQIEVTDDKVTLTGDVPSWSELNTVIGAVKGTPGVRAVDNRVRIQA